MARLGDVCSFFSGTGFPNAYQGQKTGKYPFYKVGDISKNVLLGNRELISSDNYIDDDTVQAIKGTVLPPKTVVFAKIGEALRLNRRAITNCYCLVDNNAMGILADNTVLDELYFYYFMCSVDLQHYCESTTVPSVRKTRIAEIEIPLPSLEEQRRIATVLDKVSDLITKRRAQLDKLDLLVKSRFVEMFGDCKTNPKGWNTCCLEDIAEVGSSKRVFVEELKKEGIPFYRGTEVGALAEGLTITPELFITEEHYKELCDMSGKPQKGDLLMPSICPDGRIWLVDTDGPFYFKDGRVLWVHGISDNFDSVFLLYTLKDRIMTDYSSIASGTTFAELKIFALKKCKVFNVPFELQKQFSSFIQSTSKSKLTIQQSLDKLEVLKKALMQQYFG